MLKCSIISRVKDPALRYVKLASKPLKTLIGKFSLNWKPILHMKLRWKKKGNFVNGKVSSKH